MRVRILLVTGAETWGEEVKPALSQLQFEDGPADVVMAASGWEALAHAESAAAEREPFDLAVADLVLPRPGIGGASTLIRIREFCPECRTVLVTDHDGMRDLVAGTFDAFLVRPPSAADFPSQLATKVAELLEEYVQTPVFPGGERVTTRAVVSPPSWRPGNVIADRYHLKELLGEGGMGKVFRAEDAAMGRPVAVKLPRGQSPDEREVLRQRFHREVLIAGRLSHPEHPNIVTVYDANLADVYLVMELVDGPSLDDYLKDNGPLSKEEAIRITREILSALAHAHGKGIIHRDLKPGNVLITTDGTAKVADFGLGKVGSPAASEEDTPPSSLTADITQHGESVGTPAYMAPEQQQRGEQQRGEAIDYRADLYAVGGILFEMLHGESLARMCPKRVRAAILNPDQPPPELPQLPDEPELNRVLERALAPKREDRYDSSEAFAAALPEFKSRSKPS